jgi:flagellar biosynthesis/type III secretory pathway protein FliH
MIETREKAVRDYSNDIACAKDEGKEEGKAEGIAIGEERGELKKAKAMALGLLRAGVGADIIAQTSGLSVEEINSLRNKMHEMEWK